MLRPKLNLTKLLVSVVLLALSAIIGQAQFRAGLQGTVTDGGGGTVAGAKVTLVNRETNQSQQAQTSDDGFYRFSNLAPGAYSITVEQQGFKKRVVNDVNIEAEAVKGQDINLEAGIISETVTVQAQDVALQTEDANIRKTISTDEVLQLPQAGRDPYELARLAPGVFGAGSRGSNGNSQGFPNTSGPGGSNNSIFATENVQPISANGQRVSSNNYQIDGTSVNSQTWGGGAVITPSQESVKEVQVTSSTYSAEDGRNSGAQIKVVSQNGTNRWHGSAFFKVDDPKLNAFNTMPQFVGTSNTGGPQQVNRKYKSYGGSFGGAIVKDRLFFFVTYEGMKEKTSSNFNGLVETAAFRSAVAGARSGTLIGRVMTSVGVAPRVNQILTPTCTGIFVTCAVVGNGMDLGSIYGTYGNYVPVFSTNQSGAGLDGIADVQWAQLQRVASFNGNQLNVRIDFQATNRDKITFTSYFVPNRATTSNDAAQSRPQADINSNRLTYAVGFIYARNISSTMTNEGRFNLTRWGYDETKTNPLADLTLPRIEVEGFYGDRLRFGFPRDLNTPGVINEKQLDFRDTLVNIRGNHVMKFGVEYRLDLNSNGEVGGARPLYSMNTLWNLANGTPIFEQISATLQGAPAANNTKFTTSELAFFVQDDWKIRPNLTLNLGLRWDYMSPITASGGVIGNLLLDSNNGLAGAKITTANQLYKSDFKNFGPQIGFAWNPKMLSNKLVIRGGGGMGYDRLANALLANARRNPPNGANFGICCGTAASEWGSPFVGGQITFVGSTNGSILGYPANPLLGGGANASTGLPNIGGVEIYGAPQNMPTASVVRYSLEAEYQLPANLIATLGYQGSQGRHFVRILPLQIMTTTNPHINAAYFASPDVNTSYNAMIARLQGRFLRQLSFDMNYRWAKSLDTSSFESPCACTNQSFPVDQRQEHGPSDFDVKHSFVASGTWDLPFFTHQKELAGKLLGGWQISAIATSNTGFPWTPKIFGCLNGNTSSSAGFCDPRPTSYNGTQPGANSNANFLRPNGIFGVPGTTIFGTAFNTSNPFQNLPAIGRNSLRGPKYFSLDMAFAKKFGLGSWGFLGENANVDLRFNFFNILNTLNLSPIGSNSDPTRVQLTQFGTATSALSGRVGEFQIRFSF